MGVSGLRDLLRQRRNRVDHTRWSALRGEVVKHPSQTIRPGDWCRGHWAHPSPDDGPRLVGYVGKVFPGIRGPARAFYSTRELALLDHPGDAIGFVGRDLIARCPGECRCGSRNVTMTTVYPVRGTAPGGHGRLGDPGATQHNQCNDCGREWVTS